MALFEIDWKPQPKQLRTFGLIGLCVFVFLGTWCYFRHRIFGVSLSPSTTMSIAWTLWIVGAMCGLLALTAPTLLRPLYVALTAISLPIGFVLSHVIMAVMFYGVFTPIGLLFRLMGRDPLQRELQPDAKSYWQQREQVTDMARYFRQY